MYMHQVILCDYFPQMVTTVPPIPHALLRCDLTVPSTDEDVPSPANVSGLGTTLTEHRITGVLLSSGQKRWRALCRKSAHAEAAVLEGTCTAP